MMLQQQWCRDGSPELDLISQVSVAVVERLLSVDSAFMFKQLLPLALLAGSIV